MSSFCSSLKQCPQSACENSCLMANRASEWFEPLQLIAYVNKPLDDLQVEGSTTSSTHFVFNSCESGLFFMSQALQLLAFSFCLCPDDFTLRPSTPFVDRIIRLCTAVRLLETFTPSTRISVSVFPVNPAPKGPPDERGTWFFLVFLFGFSVPAFALAIFSRLSWISRQHEQYFLARDFVPAAVRWRTDVVGYCGFWAQNRNNMWLTSCWSSDDKLAGEFAIGGNGSQGQSTEIKRRVDSTNPSRRWDQLSSV